MLVWSVQNTIVRDRLLEGHVHRVPWLQVGAADRKPFEAMADAMRAAGTEFETAPIWAWRGEGSNAAMAEVCQMLLSERDREADLVILRLQVPAGLAHLSSYSRWQDFYLGGDGVQTWSEMAEADDDASQVTLPHLEPSWLVESLPVPPPLY